MNYLAIIRDNLGTKLFSLVEFDGTTDRPVRGAPERVFETAQLAADAALATDLQIELDQVLSITPDTFDAIALRATERGLEFQFQVSRRLREKMQGK